MNGDKLVIQNSCRPAPRGRSAAVMFAGILLLCGCGTKPATPAASPAAANPGTSTAPPATPTASPAAVATAAPSPAPASAGTPAATPGPSRNPPTAPGTAAPPPTPPAPASLGRLVLALDVPAGEVLAELAKNFRGDANPHPDSVGTGTWSYALWGTANPWESPRERSPLAPQVGDSSKPRLAAQAQRPNQPLVAARVQPREGSGVAILAPENSPGYVGLRWQSGVEGQVAIVGKYGWDQPPASGDLEVLVFVDGILRSHQLLPPGMTSASAFEVKADVQPGSAVDLVVGMLFFQPEKAPNQGTLALDAAIVRTSPRPALELAADSVAKVAQAWRTAPRRPLPKTDDRDQSPDLAKVRLEWYRRVFLGAFRNTYPDDGATKGAIDNFLDGYFRQVAGEEAAPSDGELLALGKAAMSPGKADAVGYTALGTIALRHGNNEDFNYGFVRLGYAEHWFVKQSYPALVRFWYRATLPAIYQRMRDQVKGQPSQILALTER